MNLGVVGIDIGGVIVGHGYGHPDKVHDQDTTEDTSLIGGSDDFLWVHPNEGAFETIAKLIELSDSRRFVIISKCGELMERKTRTWLEWHDFYKITGFRRDHVLFCRKRPDKAQIAALWSVTHFIDDRPDVLGYMEDFVEHRYLYCPQFLDPDFDKSKLPGPMKGVIEVPSWGAFFNELT